MLPAFPANLRKQLKGAPMPAPHHIMCAAVEGAQVDIDTALRIESRYLTDLVRGQVSKNMIQAFWFDLNAINAGGSRPSGYETRKATKVAILGAGMMGAGIAYVSADAGIDVVLKDVSIDAAEKGKDYSRKILDKSVQRGKITEAKRDEILARIKPTADYADLAGCDLVVEAVFEKTSLKHEVFGETEPVVDADALLGSNTSTLPITLLAEGVKRKADFIGLHFFSPVDKLPLHRDHPRRADVGRGARSRPRLRQADQEDADRRQRQPRVLHLAGDQRVRPRGAVVPHRGRPAGDRRAGDDAGRLPGRCASTHRRAQHGALPQDPQRDPRGRRGRRRDGALAPRLTS